MLVRMSSDSTVAALSDDVPAELFKAVMGSVCTPVSVVTAYDGQRPHGTTVSAFCSLSLTPPMVLVALDHGSALLQVVQNSRRFGLNVLSHDQHAIAGKFAVKGDDKFHDVDWLDRSGAPHISGSSCWFACEVAEFVEGGDHTVVLGLVVETDHEDLPPLTYHRRVFGTHAASSQNPA
jgi:flavin reductase (DIM6/NTAB) family NADH-FMN oxidoreductase RutF